MLVSAHVWNLQIREGIPIFDARLSSWYYCYNLLLRTGHPTFPVNRGSSKILMMNRVHAFCGDDIIFVCLCHLPEITACLASCEETHGWLNSLISVAVVG